MTDAKRFESLALEMSLAKENNEPFADDEIQPILDSFIRWVEWMGMYCGGGIKGEGPE